jgi:hypothetical protein
MQSRKGFPRSLLLSVEVRAFWGGHTEDFSCSARGSFALFINFCNLICIFDQARPQREINVCTAASLEI